MSPDPRPATIPRLPEPSLLERGEELTRLEQLLDRAASGAGGSLLIEGSAGIGKSRLCAEARSRAEHRGFRTLWARGGELESGVGWGVVRELFEPVLREADARHDDLLIGSAAFARPMLGRGEAPSTSVDPPGAAIQGLFWLTASLSDEMPVLVVVDDAHWCDAPSLRWLEYLAVRTDELSLALLVASRTGEPSRAGGATESFARSAQALELQPLSAASCEMFIASELGTPVEPPFARACAEATGGNPFFLTELAGEIKAEGIAPTEANVGLIRQIRPSAVAKTVLLRLARFPGATTEVAEAVSVLGVRANVADTADLLESDQETVAKAAGELQQASILARKLPLAFTHPIVREVLYGDIPPPRRSTLHRRAADVLESRGAEPEEVAIHVLAAEPAGDPKQVERLRGAAAAAMAAGVPEMAAIYLERALSEPPTGDVSPGVQLDLGNAEAALGLPRAIERVASALDKSGSPRERAAMAKRLGEMLFSAGQLAEAKRAFERGLHELHGMDAKLAGELETLRHAMAMVSGTEEARGSRSSGVHSQHLSREAETHRALALVSACEDYESSRELALSALGNGQMLRESGVTLTFTIAASCAIWCDALEEADREIDRALEITSKRGDLPGIALVRFGRTWVNYWRGALHEALADAEIAVRAWGRGGMRGQLVGALYWQAVTLLELGQVEEAEDALALVGDESEPLFRGTIAAGRGRLALARSDPELAWREFAKTIEALPSAAYLRNPNGIAWRCDAVKALVLLGEEFRARKLADEDLTLASSFGAPRGLGIALRSSSLLDDPVTPLERSVSVLERSPSRLELCRSLLELGASVRRSGSPARSREPLMRALDLACELGATAMEGRVRDELRAAGARPRRERLSGPESLTPSELRVAELAAGGNTNREISQQLFVSLRTVETHLTHSYAKLDITSRGQLRAALRKDQEASAGARELSGRGSS